MDPFGQRKVIIAGGNTLLDSTQLQPIPQPCTPFHACRAGKTKPTSIFADLHHVSIQACPARLLRGFPGQREGVLTHFFHGQGQGAAGWLWNRPTVLRAGLSEGNPSTSSSVFSPPNPQPHPTAKISLMAPSPHPFSPAHAPSFCPLPTPVCPTHLPLVSPL